MGNVRRIYVEKKAPFAVKAKELHEELKNYLDINADNVRVFIRYDVENISDEVFAKACKTVFSEPPVDDLYEENIEVPANAKVFSVEYLPGQFDQRADSAVQCVQFLDENEEPVIKTAVVTFNIVDKEGRVSRNCEEVAGILAENFGIAVRGGYHCAGLAHKTIGTWDTGAVRMSAGPFNTRKEIKTAIDAVFKISRLI